MAGTADLATAVDYVIGRGGSVRLVGDDQQLASVAAGGVLRDIADTAGVITLSQLMRFTDRAEAAATLAIRAGDRAGIGFYLDHARVHVGDDTTDAPTRPTKPGPPTGTPGWTRSSSPPPATSPPNSTAVPGPTGSPNTAWPAARSPWPTATRPAPAT